MPNAYYITDRLGQGGFGTVYAASMSGEYGVSRDVAIKVMNASSCGSDMAARFRDEARIMASLDHPSIAKVITMTYLQGQLSIIMEKVRGTPLNKVTLPYRPLVEMVGKVAGALRYAHNRGVIHRDIKPENIILTPEGQVKVLDFGIAKIENEAREARTQTGLVIGTLRYIAPEACYGTSTPASDIYSLGVVLYEVATGRRWGKVFDRDFDKMVDKVCRRIPWVEDPTLQEMLWGMVNPNPDERLTAEVIEDWCDDNAAAFEGPSLRRFARNRTFPAQGNSEDPTDPLLGKTLKESPTPSPQKVIGEVSEPFEMGAEEDVEDITDFYPFEIEEEDEEQQQVERPSDALLGCPDDVNLEEEFQRAAWEAGICGWVTPTLTGTGMGRIQVSVPELNIYIEIGFHNPSLYTPENSPPGEPPWYYIQAGPCLSNDDTSIVLRWSKGERSMADVLKEVRDHWSRCPSPISAVTPLDFASHVHERGYRFGAQMRATGP